MIYDLLDKIRIVLKIRIKGVLRLSMIYFIIYNIYSTLYETQQLTGNYLFHLQHIYKNKIS